MATYEQGERIAISPIMLLRKVSLVIHFKDGTVILKHFLSQCSKKIVVEQSSPKKILEFDVPDRVGVYANENRSYGKELMTKILRVPLACALVFLTGCSSTGIIPMDHGTYMVSKTSPACGFRTADGTKAELYIEANQFCSQKGQEVSTINISGYDGIIGQRCASATLTFRCVPPDTKQDAETDARLRDDMQQDRTNNQADMRSMPRPVVVPAPAVNVINTPAQPTNTVCSRYGNQVDCHSQ